MARASARQCSSRSGCTTTSCARDRVRQCLRAASLCWFPAGPSQSPSQRTQGASASIGYQLPSTQPTMEKHPAVLAKRRQTRGVPSDEAICKDHDMSRPELDMLWLSALAVCARCDKSNTLRRLACANCSAPLAWECTSCTTMNLLSVVSCCVCGVGESTRRE